MQKIIRITAITMTIAVGTFFGTVLHGQVSSSSGAIRGIVQDPSGGAVANAVLTLRNTHLSLVRTIKSNRDGEYAFPYLQPTADYSITVEAPGFGRVQLDAVTVRVTETTVANVRLQLGKVTEEVKVSAATESGDTTSAALGSVVSARVITALPLPTRNVFDLLATDAGVVAALTSPAATIVASTNAIYVGGSRSTSNNYLLNGIDANSVEFNALAGGDVAIPSADSIQEFKTQTSLYDATTGYSGGGNLNIVTRAGAREFHIDAYEFLRNTIFNANDYFLNASHQQRPILIHNQFGVSAGGPIPYGRNTFFFVNYEGLRQKNGVTGSVTGSQPVLPATRDAASLATAFGLPESAIDPVAVNILQAKGPYGGYLFPSGTGSPVGTLGTYAYSSPVLSNANQASLRVDHEFHAGSQQNQLWGTFFYNRGLYINPTGASGSLGQGYDYPLGNQNLAINDTHVFNAHVVNDLAVGYTRIQRDIANYGTGVTVQDVGMYRANESAFNLLPALTFQNALSLSGTTVGRFQRTANTDFRDTLSWLVKRHTLRAGFETIRAQYNEVGVPATPLGTLAFNVGIADATYGPSPLGAAGDLAFRDFLVGAPSSISSVSGVPRYHIRFRNYVAFLQDDYQVTPRLTLNLGARYDHLGNPTETNNHFSNFDPSLLSANDAATGGANLQHAFVIAGQNGVTTSTYTIPNYGSFSPRIGFALDAFGNGRAVVRGGYGFYYQASQDAQTYMIMNPPYYVSATSTNTTRTGILANPFQSLPTPDQFPIWPTLPTITGLSPAGVPNYTGTQLLAFSVDRKAKTPYTENWDLSVQTKVLPRWFLELGYRGADGVKQPVTLFTNNGLLVDSTSSGLFGITTNSSANRDARAPINGLGVNGVRRFTHSAFTSYNALLVTVTHPVYRDFQIKGAYTYSKSIDPWTVGVDANYGTGVGNQYILGLGKGLSEQHSPNRLVVTYVWDTPTFKSRLTRDILSSWTLAGITTYQNGFAQTITQNSGNSTLTGSTGYGLLSPDCKLVASGRVEDHLQNFLNPSCASNQPLLAAGSSITGVNAYEAPVFGPASNYTISSNGSGRLLGKSTRGAYLAPFQQRWDTALSKRFPTSERTNIEFRAEAFKLFNTPIFSTPASVAGASTFGKITSTIDTTGRQFQFALKFNY
jgi:hypothetical protein